MSRQEAVMTGGGEVTVSPGAAEAIVFIVIVIMVSAFAIALCSRRVSDEVQKKDGDGDNDGSMVFIDGALQFTQTVVEVQSCFCGGGDGSCGGCG